MKEEIGIDPEKLRLVISRNWLWILGIFLLANGIAYLTIRWTKPVFESESILRLDVKDDRNLIGLTAIQDESENVLAGEIELIKSRLFLTRVLESIDLSVSYFTAGDVLRDERFRNSPVMATIESIESAGYDIPVFIEIIDKNNFRAAAGDRSDLDNSPVYHYDQLVDLGDISFRLYLSRDYTEESREFIYFFVANSPTSLVTYLDENLIVEPDKQDAKTIRIAFQDNNPYKAQALVNAIDTLYLRYTDRKKNAENEQKIAWLNTELSKIEDQLSGYENYIEEFTIENRSSDLNEDLKRVLEVMNALDSQRYELNTRIRRLSELNKNILQGNPGELLTVTSFGVPDVIQESLDELKSLIERRERLGLSYTESTMAIQRLDEGITTAQQTVTSQINGLIQQLNNELDDVNRNKSRLETEFATLPGKSNEFNKNKRFYDLYEQFYLSLMESKAQFEIARAGTSNDFVILSSATLPLEPISPKSLIIQGIGLVAGIMFCLLFIGIMYLLNNKVNNLKELESHVQSAILGSVPRVQNMGETRLIVDQRPKSSVSEALRSIRTNLQFIIGQKDQPVISITSTVSGEGKTFMAVNLGGVLAMTNKRVIVLDLDMRRPRVHHAFGDQNADRGISTVLINQFHVEDCIRRTSLETLDYIPAGPTPPNPSELLLNHAFEEMIKKLQGMYDLIILDTPPVGVVTDGKILLEKTDLTIYVVRANYSKKSFLSTIDRIHQTHKNANLALVLNSASRTTTDKYGYGYYENKKEERFSTYA